MSRRHPLFGNTNGLPGLPKTTYVTVGGRRVAQPPPPRTQQLRPPVHHAPPPSRSRPSPLPSSRAAPILNIPSGPDPTLSRRIDALDLRINSTEQGNRTLLDELMRLQQDIKTNVRKNEMGIQEERDSRSRLEMSLRQSQTRNHEVEDRIRRNEEGIKDNRGAIQQLAFHVTSVEKMVTSLQQELIEKRNDTSNKQQEQRHELSRLAVENEQLDKMVNGMREEARTTGSRVDNLQDEILQLQNSIRLQSRLMDDYANRPPPKTPGVDKRLLDNERMNSEAKIMQLNTTIQDLSARLSSEATKRDKMEKEFTNKLNLLTSELSEKESRGEKAQREYDEKMSSVQLGFAETDKKQMRMELSRVSNELNTKIDKNDVNLRQVTFDKLTIIESTLQAENEKRNVQQNEVEKKLQDGLTRMQKEGSDNDNMIGGTLKKLEADSDSKLKSVNGRLNDVEKGLRVHKLEQEKLLSAEITERLTSHGVLDSKIEDFEDDVSLGFKTLQNEIGKISKQQKGSSKAASKKGQDAAPPSSTVDLDEIKEFQEEKAEGIRRKVAKDIGELETRLARLETEVKQKENIIENRLQTSKAEDSDATSFLGDQMQQQIDSLVVKQNKLRKKVDDLEKDIADTPKSLKDLREDTEASTALLKKGLMKEEKERKDDIADLQTNIKKILGSENEAEVPSLAQLNVDMDQTQTGLKKCAESIHVVKTLLGDKIKDEGKIRSKQVAILETDVDRLDTKIKELKERIKLSPDLGDTLTDLDDII